LTAEPSKVVPRTVRHITIETGRPYDVFRTDYEKAVPAFDRLEAIGVVASGAGWGGIRALSEATALHGFVNFFTFDPSPVMKQNGNTSRAVTYLTGNIVMAERGFRIDPSCFLYVPLRIVIAESVDGDARLSLDQPTDLFAIFHREGLDEVAVEFGRVFALLLEHLGVPVPPELASLEL
jgi:uncharacterized protein (DUF302 family)